MTNENFKVGDRVVFINKEKAEGGFGGVFYPKIGTLGSIIEISDALCMKVKWDTIKIPYWCVIDDVYPAQRCELCDCEEVRKETAEEILTLLGKGFDENTAKDFKELSWYKQFCRELKFRYNIEIEVK